MNIEEEFLPECDYCVRITKPELPLRDAACVCPIHHLYHIAWMIIKSDVRTDGSYYAPPLDVVVRTTRAEWFKQITCFGKQTLTIKQIEDQIRKDWRNGNTVVDYMTGIHPTVYEARINRKD